MTSKNAQLLLVVIAFVCLTALPFARSGMESTVEIHNVAGSLQSAKERNQSDNFRERFEKLVKTRNLDGLEKLMGELSKMESREWFDLLLDVCCAFNSYDFGDSRQYRLTRECSKSFLESNDDLPPSVELRLLENLQGTEEYTSGLLSMDDWPADRSARMRLLHNLWSRYKKEWDPDFDIADVKNRPVGNVPVPGPYMPGIRPQDIKEPEIRAKYLQALAENKIKAEKFNLQVQLNRMSKKLPAFVERMFVNLYDIDPRNPGELEANLRLFGMDQEARLRIMTALGGE